MIRELDIWNLKSFMGHHRIELAPITLVYGPNSAGKSSLLHSLALMKQTLEPVGLRVDLETPPLALKGELVDLGSFGTAVHRHDRSQMLGVGVRFSDRRQHRSQPVSRRLISREDVYGAVTFEYDSKRKAPVQKEAALGLGGDVSWFKAVNSPTARRDVEPAEPATPVFSLRDSAATDAFLRIARPLLDEWTLAVEPGSAVAKARAAAAQAVEERFGKARQVRFHGRGFFPTSPSTKDLFRDIAGNDEESSGMYVRLSGAVMRMADPLRAAAGSMEDLFSRLAYLGPLRAAPARFHQLSNELPTNVGASGEYTPMLLARDDALVSAVNGWLERLEMPYTLSVETVTSETVGLELGDLLATTLRDTRNGIAVTPQDVGFGVSQLLPVVVQLLSGTRRTVLVEQPEIHIHPRLQAEVGDLLLAAAGPGHFNQVIVETHSEHLMLRIQRRLNERDSWAKPDDVAVVYIDVDEDGRAVPRRLRLDDDGRFIDEWPRGFFAERMNELFTPRRSNSAPKKAPSQ